MIEMFFHVLGIHETFYMHALFNSVFVWFPGARYYYPRFAD